MLHGSLEILTAVTMNSGERWGTVRAIVAAERCATCGAPAEFRITRADGMTAACQTHSDQFIEGLTAAHIAQSLRRFTDEQYLAHMLAGYLEAACWTRGLELEDLTPAEFEGMRDDCADFFADNRDELRGFMPWAEFPGQAGHDFSLTRDGHGAGFWDRGAGEVGDSLAHAARVYGADFVAAELAEFAE